MQTINLNRLTTLIGLGIALSLLGDATLYVILPTQYAQAGLLLTHVGIMLSANRAIRVLFNTPIGWWIERSPRRRILVPAMILGGIASLFYTFQSFELFLIGRLLWGIAWSGMAIGTVTMILDVADDTNRGRMMGRYQLWFFIGVGVSSIAGGVLFDLVGFNLTFYISAGVIIFLGILWFVFLPETYGTTSATTELTDETSDESPVEKPKNQPLPYVPIAIVILMNGLNWMIFIGATISLLPILLQIRIHPTLIMLGALTIPIISFTGILSATANIASLSISYISGWLADKFRERWLWVMLALLLGSLNLSLFAVTTGWLIVLGALGNGVVRGILSTQLNTLVGDYTQGTIEHQQKRGRILGFFNTAGDIGGAIGPFLAFLLLPTLGLDGIFVLAVVILGLTIPLTFWMKRAYPLPEVSA